jgi:hypothetical protein
MTELVDEEVDGRELDGSGGDEVGAESWSDSMSASGAFKARREGMIGSCEAGSVDVSRLGRGGDSNESINTVPASCQQLQKKRGTTHQ